jgi:hypothetical protein
MTCPKLIIGNKAYSSWSLRPWMVMREFGIAFEEEAIPLYCEDSKTRLLAYSSAAKAPILVDQGPRVVEAYPPGGCLEANPHPCRSPRWSPALAGDDLVYRESDQGVAQAIWGLVIASRENPVGGLIGSLPLKSVPPRKLAKGARTAGFARPSAVRS